MKRKIGTLRKMDNNLYKDSYGTLIIIEKSAENSYICEPHELKWAKFFQSRYIFSFAVLALAGIYLGWILGIVAGLATCCLFEFAYWKKFLPTLERIEKLTPPQKESYSERFGKDALGSNILRIVASIALPTMLIVNLFTTIKDWSSLTTENLLLVVLTVVISGFALYIAFSSLQAILKRRK